MHTEEWPKQKQGVQPLGLDDSRLKNPGLHLEEIKARSGTAFSGNLPPRPDTELEELEKLKKLEELGLPLTVEAFNVVFANASSCFNITLVCAARRIAGAWPV